MREPDLWPAEQAAGVREIEHVWVPLADGVRLSARVWLPRAAEALPVPAILEYLPYRKDDATAAGDAARHPWFAAHGYASLRVDLRGTGSSEGVCLGEYLRQEQDDALELIAWIAAQPWCDGNVGMIGYSWGGFNGLQIAARRPPQLKAVISGYSTDDRYTDDCHYQGGCLLASDMLKWASWMHALNARPPDPRFAGDAWRAQWLERLDQTPPYIEDWMAHPLRDEFWRQGSISEDYGAIAAATLLFGGLADPYRNTVPRMLEKLSCPRAAIVGPWGHVLPSHGIPGPEIGFLQECVRWYDRWLKGIDNGIDSEPRLRVFVQDTVPPSRDHRPRTGTWLGEDWPSRHVTTQLLELRPDGSLGERTDATPAALSIASDEACGLDSGVWCANGEPAELPDDQRGDDARSLCFDAAALPEPLVLLGRPVARLRLAADAPTASVAARLCAVAPDGASTLLGYGLLNLTHRDGDDRAVPLEPGRHYDVAVELGFLAERIPAGHRLRLAISPTYWPHSWPAPQPVALSVETGGASVLELPVRDGLVGAAPVRFGPAVESGPVTGTITGDGGRTRALRDDPAGGLEIEDAYWSALAISATATSYRETATDRWRITPGDPLSASVECTRELELSRDGWHTRVVTFARQRGDATGLLLETGIEAFEGEELVFRRRRAERVERHGY